MPGRFRKTAADPFSYFGKAIRSIGRYAARKSFDTEQSSTTPFKIDNKLKSTRSQKRMIKQISKNLNRGTYNGKVRRRNHY